MGIEFLNSAVAAAGFAMVSEEGMDVTEVAMTRLSVAPRAASTGQALVVLGSSSRAPTTVVQVLGERVTGFLDVFRPRG